MSIYYRDIEQLTEEWFEIKHGKVGGSSASDLFVNKPLKESAIFYKILGESMEDFFYDEDRQGFVSYDMQLGLDGEEYTIEQLEQLTGLKFNPIGWVQSKISILGISPDGLTDDNRFACECKRLKSNTYAKYLVDGYLPLEHVGQCVDYFASIDELEKLYFAGSRPENKIKPLFVVELTMDSEIIIGFTAKKKATKTKEAEPRKPILSTIRIQVAELKNKAIELENLVDETIKDLEF